MDLSLVLTTFNRSKILAQTLESLSTLHLGGAAWEVLLVDNTGGDPETRAVAQAFSGRLPLELLIEPRPGTNYARNQAVEQARAPLIVFTDDDVAPDPDWLTELRGGVARWPDTDLFGGRILPLWPEGGQPPSCHSFLENAYAIADWKLPEGPYSAHRVFGPNMAYRASIFHEGWRFDPRIGPDGSDTYMTGSETSLNLELERAGFRPVYLPRALVRHRVQREHLHPAWLYKRAFRLGRWEAHLAGVSRGAPGTLAWLLWKLGRAYMNFAIARAGADLTVTLDAGLTYWQARGALHQWRRTDAGRAALRGEARP